MKYPSKNLLIIDQGDLKCYLHFYLEELPKLVNKLTSPP